jgi:hypothetical protein
MDFRFQAISISSRLLEIISRNKFSGSVTGVYTSAANFSFGKYLITAADITHGNLPYGFLCDFSKIDLKKTIHIGDSAEIDSDSLRISKRSFEILFQSASLWSHEFRMPIEKKDIPNILSNIGYIEQQLTQRKNLDGLAPLIRYIPQILGNISSENMHFALFGQIAYDSLCLIINSIRSQDKNALTRSIKKLVGLGVGLTPSGDDVLMGLFATLLITMKGTSRNWLVNAYRNMLVQIHELTNEVSLSYLNAIRDGYYPERFSNLVSAIIRSGKPKDIYSPLEEMLQWGSTSGSEIILGILLGFSLSIENLNQGYLPAEEG